MTYHIIYHADGWVRAETGAPELRQVSTADIGDGTELVAVLVCGMDGDPPRVVEAPMCPTHNRAMKRLQYPTKQGHQWHCTAKIGDDWCEERA